MDVFGILGFQIVDSNRVEAPPFPGHPMGYQWIDLDKYMNCNKFVKNFILDFLPLVILTNRAVKYNEIL
jgi:hypothetical protein